MSKRAVIWTFAAVAAVTAAVAYAIFFTPLFHQPQMQLSVRYTVPPGRGAAVLNVVFSLGRMYELTAVRVERLPPEFPPPEQVPQTDAPQETAGEGVEEPVLVWEMAGSPHSQALSAFRFGQPIEGMTEQVRAALERGGTYRMTVESRDLQAYIDFQARPNIRARN
ncbi:MAG: hypothetical protein IT445_07265 [Phycisphaeraceae bacterium]|nr:hypothetical protein [Phycisphaeraceae bacterium]